MSSSTRPASAVASWVSAPTDPRRGAATGSAITSPRLMPMRHLIRRSSGTSGWRSSIPRCTSAAQRNRVDDAGEFHQQPVAGGLDDAAVMLGDLRVDQLPANRFEAFEGTFL